MLNSASYAAMMVYAYLLTLRGNRERQESGIYFKMFEKTQYSMNTLYIVANLHAWPLICASSYMYSHPRHISVWFALQWSRNQGKIQRISFWIDKNTNFRVQLQRKALLFIIWNFRRRETCTYIEQIGKYRYWISLFLLNLTIRIKELNLCVSLNLR